MYQVTGTVVELKDGWREVRQIPTFYLDRAVQGIVDAQHAVKIAQGVVDPLGKATEVHLYAVLV